MALTTLLIPRSLAGRLATALLFIRPVLLAVTLLGYAVFARHLTKHPLS